jgi:hypothetical protein
MTQREDGKWRALRNMEILRGQRLATAIYRSVLADEAQKLGYGIEQTGTDGRWEIEGYSRDQVMHFSHRRQEFEQRMEETGLQGAKAQQIFAYSTRQAKGPATKGAELTAGWKEDVAAIGLDGAALLSLALTRTDQRQGTAKDCQTALEYAVNHLNERDAIIDRRALEAAALQFGMGRVTPDAIRAHIDMAEAQGQLIRAQNSDWRHAQGTFTTPQAVALEHENLALVENGKHDAPAVGNSVHVRLWAAWKGLSPDQLNAANVTLTSHDWVTAIEGWAGAAKNHHGRRHQAICRGARLHGARFRDDVDQQEGPGRGRRRGPHD